MAAAAIIVAVILLVTVLRFRRLQEMRAFNWLVIPTLLSARSVEEIIPIARTIDMAISPGGHRARETTGTVEGHDRTTGQVDYYPEGSVSRIGANR